MGMNDTALTILHVEDDPILVKLVQAAFAGFGFRGRMISAGRVDEALDLLDRYARDRLPISLILVDMQLPDGVGLEVIRQVKSDPVWQTTPIIALSGEMEPGIIDGAYSLGANCFMPKAPPMKSPLDLLQSLYECWLRDALLPRPSSRDRLQSALDRAVRLRASFADFYIRLARVFDGEPEQAGFWLDCALSEGNLSNLLVFFQNRVSEDDVSFETVDRLAIMQVRVRKALLLAEERLERNATPRPVEVCRWVLDFADALDEELFAEVIACLFPKGPVAAAALKVRAALHLKALANHILKNAEEPELRQRAGLLLGWGERLAAGMETC